MFAWHVEIPLSGEFNTSTSTRLLILLKCLLLQTTQALDCGPKDINILAYLNFIIYYFDEKNYNLKAYALTVSSLLNIVIFIDVIKWI